MAVFRHELFRAVAAADGGAFLLGLGNFFTPKPACSSRGSRQTIVTASAPHRSDDPRRVDGHVAAADDHGPAAASYGSRRRPRCAAGVRRSQCLRHPRRARPPCGRPGSRWPRRTPCSPVSRSWASVTSLPTSTPQRISTPSSRSTSISASMTSFSSLKEGMPYRSMPPGRAIFLKHGGLVALQSPGSRRSSGPQGRRR